MPSLIYTNQRSKLSKKQRAAREALLKEQRAIKRELKATQSQTTATSPVVSSPHVRQTEKIKSLGNGMGVATKAEPKVYTGDKMIGIGQMHKSNAVPIFSSEDAEAIAKMRR